MQEILILRNSVIQQVLVLRTYLEVKITERRELSDEKFFYVLIQNVRKKLMKKKGDIEYSDVLDEKLMLTSKYSMTQ